MGGGGGRIDDDDGGGGGGVLFYPLSLLSSALSLSLFVFVFRGAYHLRQGQQQRWRGWMGKKKRKGKIQG